MVTRIGGNRRKTRSLMSKNCRDKGKISLRRYLQDLAIGAKVALVAEPAVQSGLFHRRFFGKIGKVMRKQGACYVVGIKDGDKAKEVIVHPVHLRSVD